MLIYPHIKFQEPSLYTFADITKSSYVPLYWLDSQRVSKRIDPLMIPVAN